MLDGSENPPSITSGTISFFSRSTLLFIYILPGSEYPKYCRQNDIIISHVVVYLYSRWETVSFDIVGGTISLFLTISYYFLFIFKVGESIL